MEHVVSDKEKMFTSTGEKLLYHSSAMKKFQDTGLPTPIVMHIMPTSKCNLRCNFCSVKDRESDETLTLEEDIKPVVEELSGRGLEAAILSGGGEPMLHKDFGPIVEYLKEKDLEVGVITNGTLFERFPESFYENFSWIRVSINSLENGGKVRLPKIRSPIIGFSYVTNSLTTEEKLKDIRDLARSNNVDYVRVLPDCAQPYEKLEADHNEIARMVNELGPPLFHQYKIPSPPNKCFLGFFHPVLYCDGNIYPCDSLVLNDHKNQQFKKDFIISSARDVGKLYNSPASSLVNPRESCPNCVFERQNTLLEKVIDGDVTKFKNEYILHKNFI